MLSAQLLLMSLKFLELGFAQVPQITSFLNRNVCTCYHVKEQGGGRCFRSDNLENRVGGYSSVLLLMSTGFFEKVILFFLTRCEPLRIVFCLKRSWHSTVWFPAGPRNIVIPLLPSTPFAKKIFRSDKPYEFIKDFHPFMRQKSLPGHPAAGWRFPEPSLFRVPRDRTHRPPSPEHHQGSGCFPQV
jgi:hypothetical protein